jgi:hypothetical protein
MCTATRVMESKRILEMHGNKRCILRMRVERLGCDSLPVQQGVEMQPAALFPSKEGCTFALP